MAALAFAFSYWCVLIFGFNYIYMARSARGCQRCLFEEPTPLGYVRIVAPEAISAYIDIPVPS